MSKRPEISEEELEAWINGVHQSCPCEGRRDKAGDSDTKAWIASAHLEQGSEATEKPKIDQRH